MWKKIYQQPGSQGSGAKMPSERTEIIFCQLELESYENDRQEPKCWGDYVENYPKFYRNPMSYSHFSLYLLNDLVVHVF